MIGLLLGNWKLIALGLAALAVAGVIGAHFAHDRHVVRERDEARVAALTQTINYGRALVNRVVLEAAITRQNASITALGEASARASQIAQEGLRRARAAHLADEGRIAALRRPLVAATACLRSDEAAQRARLALGS